MTFSSAGLLAGASSTFVTSAFGSSCLATLSSLEAGLFEAGDASISGTLLSSRAVAVSASAGFLSWATKLVCEFSSLSFVNVVVVETSPSEVVFVTGVDSASTLAAKDSPSVILSSFSLDGDAI